MPLGIERIRIFPVVVAREEYQPKNVHESCLRAYQILERVKWLLREGASGTVALQEIAEMEWTPRVEEAE